MPETRRSEGRMVIFSDVTAASNMTAGDMAAMSGHTVYSLSSGALGLTGTIGYSFVGIIDKDISAGIGPVHVWTEGLFELPLASGALDANLYPGFPIWSDGSGYVTTPGLNGDAIVGTIVGIKGGSWGSTGTSPYVIVKINPIMFNRTTTEDWGFQRV